MDYNGSRNKQTWNITLWIDNNEPLYHAAMDFMSTYKGQKPYTSFIRFLGLENEKNPDGIKWFSTRVCYRELNAMMAALND